MIKMNSSSQLSEEKSEINKVKTKDLFNNLKNDYFLQKLFNHLLKMKSLDIIKYNKNIKNRMNISIKDYKEYSEIYSSIEIEIKPLINKNGKFINIKKEDKNYYHIYFNDNKKEIKRNILNKKNNVEKLKIIIDYQIKSFKGLFEGCKCIEYIYFNKFYQININNILNILNMFNRCSSLKELNLSNVITNNVTDMRSMFHGCSSLKE